MLRKNIRPKFVLFAAVSLDGRITAGKTEGSAWTSKEDKSFFQRELDRADVAVMGRKTFDAIRRPLTPRNRIVFTRSSFAEQKLLGFTRSRPFCYSQEQQNGQGATICFSGTRQGLLTVLHERGWHRVAIVGGTSIYDWFLKRNLVDEIYLTLEPVIFGSGKPLTAQSLTHLSRFKLASTKRLNRYGTLLLHYKSLT